MFRGGKTPFSRTLMTGLIENVALIQGYQRCLEFEHIEMNAENYMRMNWYAKFTEIEHFGKKDR